MPVGYGYAESRSSASTSSSSSVSSPNAISSRPDTIRALKPVAHSAALRARSASAGSTRGTFRGFVFAPAHLAAISYLGMPRENGIGLIETPFRVVVAGGDAGGGDELGDRVRARYG